MGWGKKSNFENLGAKLGFCHWPFCICLEYFWPYAKQDKIQKEMIITLVKITWTYFHFVTGVLVFAKEDNFLSAARKFYLFLDVLAKWCSSAGAEPDFTICEWFEWTTQMDIPTSNLMRPGGWSCDMKLCSLFLLPHLLKCVLRVEKGKSICWEANLFSEVVLTRNVLFVGNELL